MIHTKLKLLFLALVTLGTTLVAQDTQETKTPESKYTTLADIGFKDGLTLILDDITIEFDQSITIDQNSPLEIRELQMTPRACPTPDDWNYNFMSCPNGYYPTGESYLDDEGRLVAIYRQDCFIRGPLGHIPCNRLRDVQVTLNLGNESIKKRLNESKELQTDMICIYQF